MVSPRPGRAPFSRKGIGGKEDKREPGTFGEKFRGVGEKARFARFFCFFFVEQKDRLQSGTRATDSTLGRAATTAKLFGEGARNNGSVRANQRPTEALEQHLHVNRAATEGRGAPPGQRALRRPDRAQRRRAMLFAAPRRAQHHDARLIRPGLFAGPRRTGQHGATSRGAPGF